MKLRRKKSKRVNERANQLFAVMANRAAATAVIRAGMSNWPGAEEAAGKAVEYMERAGADAVRYHYKAPQ